jgi:DNA-directed RNA polymerase specialized sigma24 family protein
MKILEKRSEVKDASSLHSYLCAMAKNEAIDFAKKRSREQSSDLLEDICVSKQESQLDYFLPYDLTKEEKKIIGYRLTFSLSWKEVGELLNIPVPTAKLRYVQAIKKIKGVYKR